MVSGWPGLGSCLFPGSGCGLGFSGVVEKPLEKALQNWLGGPLLGSRLILGFLFKSRDKPAGLVDNLIGVGCGRQPGFVRLSMGKEARRTGCL